MNKRLEALKHLDQPQVQSLLDIVINCQHAIDIDQEFVQFDVVARAPWSPHFGQSVPLSDMPDMVGAPHGFVTGVQDKCDGSYALRVDVDAVDLRAWAEAKLTGMGVEIKALQVEARS